MGLPLISPQSPWWPCWLREAGIAVPIEARRRGVLMPSQANDGNAAMAGQGIAMLSPFFWQHDLAERRLVPPFPQVSTLGQSYWRVVPEHRRSVVKIRRFRDWLLDEVEHDLTTLPSPLGRPRVR